MTREPDENPFEQVARSVGDTLAPAWRRATEGEARWSVGAATLVAIGLQLTLPERLTLSKSWVVPSIEGALFVALVVVNPRVNQHTKRIRVLALALIAAMTFANTWSVEHLIKGLINGTEGQNANQLLADGAAIWLTNVVVFAIWYWEFDRGGPGERAHGHQHVADLVFPQMLSPELAAPDWEPKFVDYLYVSFTNATAFSPTDTLPFTRWAKLTMMVQSAVSLATVGLVIARAVNILR